jgi:hypothetical protein
MCLLARAHPTGACFYENSYPPAKTSDDALVYSSLSAVYKHAVIVRLPRVLKLIAVRSTHAC